MSGLLLRLTENFLCFTRRHDDLLAASRRVFEEGAAIESSYARYDSPAYLRRRVRARR